MEKIGWTVIFVKFDNFNCAAFAIKFNGIDYGRTNGTVQGKIH